MGFLLLLLTGCSPACHKANFWNGGYQESQVNDHEFVVTYREGVVSGYLFETNYFDKERILVLRAAELTLQNGFTHFDLRKGNSPDVVHIHCYANEATDTAIDALAFTERYAISSPIQEQKIAMEGDI